MRLIRAEIRSVPDTVLKLIKTFAKTLDKNKKLTHAEVIAHAVAKLTGTYTKREDGSYIYVPQYEVCPECAGLIDKDDYNNPPSSEDVDAWKAIRRQHVTRCAWVTMAMAGRFSQPTATKAEPVVAEKPKSNVIEMKHEEEPTIEKEPEPIAEETTQATEPLKPEQVLPTKRKPTLDEMQFEGEETETYMDEFGGMKTRVVRVDKKKIVDDSDTIENTLTDPKYKDKDAMSVTMVMGESTGGQAKDGEMKAQMGGRESAQGKVSEKDVDDKTMVMKTDVQGEPPDILLDKTTGDIVEKREEDAVPLRVAKERVNKDSATYKSLDDIPFEE